MALEVVRGSIQNINASNELINTLSDLSPDDKKEILYLAYPIAAIDEGNNAVDGLMLSEQYGLVAFTFAKSTDEISSLQAEQDILYFQLRSMLEKSPNLRTKRDLAVLPLVITLMPDDASLPLPEDETYLFCLQGDLAEILNQYGASFDHKYYAALVESVQRISKLKPKKKRKNTISEYSKGAIIKKIETEIANLDPWQSRATLEAVEGPQRIRGLAGSGKTIVLALKAAYLHALHPEWEIIVTYYTRSLCQQFKDLIGRFCLAYNDMEPDWEKLHVIHSWGSVSEEGVYSAIAHSVGVVPLNYANAREKYGKARAFEGACASLTKYLNNSDDEIYDAVLIDEAQDLPASFFKLVYKATKSPKRIVWAYDELQNLNNAAMPSLEEMFGCDENNRCVVDLTNRKNHAQVDIVLPICYRNPPWILTLAHAFGFGLYHDPLIQHFADPKLWEDIGYEVLKGELKYNARVSLKRSADSTPSFFADLLNPEDVIQFQYFRTREEQYKWIAERIKENITDEELDPDDILVVFPNALEAKSDYYNLASFLAVFDIESFLAGVTGNRDIFKQDNMVCCSSIYRAKGNEAPMVYVANSDYCYEGLELIKLRNIMFTAATRSRAWVRFCGVGDSMKDLMNEYELVKSNQFELNFTIPTEKEMEELLTVHRDRNDDEARRIDGYEKSVEGLIKLLRDGELEAYQIPALKTLATFISSDASVRLDDEDQE